MHPGLVSWKNLLVYSFNAFSTPLLLKTLFDPWKRDDDVGRNSTFLERFVFAIISRVLGFIARLFLILVGLIFYLLTVCTFPIFFFVPFKISTEYLQSLGSVGASLSYGDTYTLNAHSRDVLSPIALKLFGKEKTFRMIERGLDKDTNHNVLLVGETGSGKTTVVDYLGRLGRSGLSFPGIRNHRVVELFMEGISIEDFDQALREANSAGNVVLVIENIHSYENIFDRIMPYLVTSSLGVVVTTDFANYDRVLKNYPEFLSKFEKVDVLPSNFEDTVNIIKNHVRISGTRIKDDAVLEIVRLSDRYIGNQPQPLKSLLILEELRSLRKTITIEDVEQVISDKTNMPIGALSRDERSVLVGLEDAMKRKIIGQEEAVKDVCNALQRLRTGISDPSKPAGSFLFLGPTGVGKTYTAKILAESYFGRKNAMIRFDMTEFSLPESVPTFVDRLASVIEEAPLSLVFLDELEKSNRMIQNLFLQILDEGGLTRGTGREVSFKDALIIATSNAGSATIIQNPNIDKKTLVSDLIRNNIFAPEFLNRFSSVVLFGPLSADEVREVAKLLLNELAQRLLEDKNIKLEITEALVDKIALAGFDLEFGARPIKRAIEDIVENKVADYIMAGNTGGTLKIL